MDMYAVSVSGRIRIDQQDESDPRKEWELKWRRNSNKQDDNGNKLLWIAICFLKIKDPKSYG